MKLSDMISELTTLKGELGDVEVLISDGFNGSFYRGNYTVQRININGDTFVDIGIGGCLDDDEYS